MRGPHLWMLSCLFGLLSFGALLFQNVEAASYSWNLRKGRNPQLPKSDESYPAKSASRLKRGKVPESCFLFALTRQKLPPFCQQGYLRTQGLVGTESLRQHGVESGLLQDYAAAGRPWQDSSQQPDDHGPGGYTLDPGPPVQALDSNKEEL